MALPPRQDIPPLNWQTPIALPDGTASPEFRRWWQIMFGNGNRTNATLEEVEAQVLALIDAELQAGAGIEITPDGHLLSSPTIAANIQTLLDLISSTRGSVLYRGDTAWAALGPGTAGQFLKTNGAGADPEWASGGSGGGNPVSFRFATGGTSQLSLGVNSTSYVTLAESQGVVIDFASTAFTSFRLMGYGQSNAAAQTVTLQLVNSSGTALHTGGNDVVLTNGYAVFDSGWKTIDISLSGVQRLVTQAKGSNASVDVDFRYFDVLFDT